MILLSIILFFTLTEAIHEGFALQNKKALAGVIESIKLLGLLLLVPFLVWYDGFDTYLRFSHNFWAEFLPSLTVGWIFIRYSIFDYVHNLMAGLPLNYIGNTKFSDKSILQRINTMWGPSFFRWTRFLSLLVGLSLILQL